jgi:hypothetical protein
MVWFRLRLTGGTVVPFTGTNLVPNQGHIHVYVDGQLVSMPTGGLAERLKVSPGRHEVRAEFVANDHGPFVPAVQASVRFTVSP